MAALGSGRRGRCRLHHLAAIVQLGNARYYLLTCKLVTGEEAEGLAFGRPHGSS